MTSSENDGSSPAGNLQTSPGANGYRRRLLLCGTVAIAILLTVGALTFIPVGHHQSSLRVGSPSPSSGGSGAVPWLDQPVDPASAYPVPTTTTTSLPPAPPAPPCRSSALTQQGTPNGAAGTAYLDLVFTNVSQAGCRLAGTPRLLFFDSTGRAVPVPYNQLSNDPATSWSATSPVYLGPGGRADLTILASDIFCRSATAFASTALVLPVGDRISLGTTVAGGPGGGCQPLPPGQAGVSVGPFSPDRPLVAPAPPPSPFVLLTATIEAPASIAAGQTLDYFVTLTNPTAEPISLSSQCPAYTESLATTAALPNVWVHPTYRLNCGPVPSMAPGQSTRFAMRLAVPANIETGSGTLFWELLGIKKAASAPIAITGGSGQAPTTIPGPQAITVAPGTGLTDGETVTISGSGFVQSGETLAVVECADNGAQTGAGDCDLHNIKAPVTADASGNVSTSYVVHQGPFGSNNIVCNAGQKCLLSLATAGSATPDQVASTDISFAS